MTESTCGGGTCLFGFETCSVTCTSDDDCSGANQGSAFYRWTLGFTCEQVDVGRMCVPRCGDDVGTAPMHACMDGKHVSCATLDDTHCNACNSCGEGEICKPGMGCEPEPQLGEPCEHDGECASGNCSALSGVCRVPIGSSCDATNCDNCFVSGDYSFCSADCLIEFDERNIGSGFVCIDRYDDGSSRYFRVCSDRDDRSCPEQCSEYLGAEPGTEYYCACKGCTEQEYQRPLGERCTTAGHCATGECTRFGREHDGLCTQTCTSDAECGEEARCAGGLCLAPCADERKCPAGQCVAFDLAGEIVDLCDPHVANGGACFDMSWCSSGSCIDSVCRGSAALGAACSVDGDCAEGRCCSGTCHSAC